MNAPELVAVAFADGEYVAIPASGHALVLVLGEQAGGPLAVCFCGEARTADTTTDAVTAVDAHITVVTA